MGAPLLALRRPRSVQPPPPVWRHPSRRPGHRLLRRVGRRGHERRALQVVLVDVVPEPVLTRLEAAHHRMPGLRGVGPGVLGRRGVAAADVPALRAAAQVEPPPAGLLALDAAGPARPSGGVDAPDVDVAHDAAAGVETSARMASITVTCGAMVIGSPDVRWWIRVSSRSRPSATAIAMSPSVSTAIG